MKPNRSCSLAGAVLMLLLASVSMAQFSNNSKPLATGSGPVWVKVAPGALPEGAVTTATGTGGSANAEGVCRTSGGPAALVPGSVVGGKCQAVATDGRTALNADAFDILLGDKMLQWNPADARSREAPPTAVQAGGTPRQAHYVCRAHPLRGSADMNMHVGRVDAEGRRCGYVEPTSGAVKFTTEFDYLIERETRSRQGDGKVFEKRADRDIQCDANAAEASIRSIPGAGGWSQEIMVRYPGKETVITEVMQDECLTGAFAADSGPDAQAGRGQFPASTVRLKQERFDASFGQYGIAADGRVYFLHWQWADDPKCEGWVEVAVPPSRGRQAVVSLPWSGAGGSADRINSLQTADPGWCSAGCVPQVTITPVDQNWVEVTLQNLPATSQIVRITQNECRDGTVTATIQTQTKVRILKKWFQDTGRIYTVYYECLGREYSTGVLVSTNGVVATDTKPHTEYEVHVASIPVDSECCEPVAGFVNEFVYDGGNSMMDVKFKTRATSKVLKVTQDECVKPDAFDGQFTDTSVQVRNDRCQFDGEPTSPCDGRVYTIQYLCGGLDTWKAKVDVPRGNVLVDSRRAGLEYESTKPSSACECCTPNVKVVKEIVNGTPWATVTLDELPAGSTVSRVTQDDCRSRKTVEITQTTNVLRLLWEYYRPVGRIYSLYYTCQGCNEKVVRIRIEGTDKWTVVRDVPTKEYDVVVTNTPLDVIDPECCMPTSEFVTELNYAVSPGQMTDVKFKTYAPSTIQGIHQDECVTPDTSDGEWSGQSVLVRNDRFDKGNGRVYRIAYECGKPLTTHTADVWVPKGVQKIVSPKMYDSTIFSDLVANPECDVTPPNPVTCTFLKNPMGLHSPEGCLLVQDGSQVDLGGEFLKFLIVGKDDVTPDIQLIKKILSITTDERTTQPPGSLSPDAGITGDVTGWVRREAQLGGDGRVYIIKFSATDAAGNVGEGSCRCLVTVDPMTRDCSGVVDSRAPGQVGLDATQNN